MHVVLSLGNSVSLPTGYGKQGMLLLRAILAADGGTHTVTILAWNYQVLGPDALRPISTPDFARMVPSMAAVYDAQSDADKAAWRARVTWSGNPYEQFPAPIYKKDLNRLILNTNADLFLCLQDVFMYQQGPFACPACMWMPLHFLPVEKATTRALSDFDILVGISGFGAELLQMLFGAHHGLPAMKHVEFIPHGCDPAIFKPGPHQLDASDYGVAAHRAHKVALRRALGWPTHSADAGAPDTPPAWAEGPGGDGAVHITLLVASNSEESGRKAFDAQLAAWVAFAERRDAAGYPRDATYLVIHAEATRAYDLGRLLETYGELPERGALEDLADRRGRTKADTISGVKGARVAIVPPTKLGRTPEADMAAAYVAADCLLAATAAEGCGVPIIEAQLCGCPCITNHTTAMPEQTLLGVSARAGQYVARMDFNAGWFLPDVAAVADALWAVSTWNDVERAERAAKTVPIAQARYGSDVVIGQWVELLGRLDRDVVTPWRAGLAVAKPRTRAFGMPLPPDIHAGDEVGECKAPTATDKGASTKPARTPQEPWRTDFEAWLSAPPLAVGLPPERAACLVAARAAEEHATAAARTTANVTALSQLRGRIATRLEYVTAAIAALESATTLAEATTTTTAALTPAPAPAAEAAAT